MGKALYIGDDSYKARKIKKIYIGGSDGKAHKVKKIYVGDANGIARLAWSSGISSFTRSTMSLANSGYDWVDNGTKFLAFGGGAYTTYVYDYNPASGSYSTLASYDFTQSVYPRYSTWLDNDKVIVMQLYQNSSYPDKRGVNFFIYNATLKKIETGRTNTSSYLESGNETQSFCIVNNIVHTIIGGYEIEWDLSTYNLTATKLSSSDILPASNTVLINNPERTKGYVISYSNYGTRKVLRISGRYGSVDNTFYKEIDLDLQYNWNVIDLNLLIEAKEYGEYWWYVPSAQIVLALDINSLTVRYIPCLNTGTYIAIGTGFPCAYNRALKTIYMFQDSRNCVKLQANE